MKVKAACLGIGSSESNNQEKDSPDMNMTDPVLVGTRTGVSVLERIWYSIEMDGNEKVIHYHGFSYEHGWNDDGVAEYSFVDLTWCYVPLADVVAEEGSARYELLYDNAALVQQYQGEFPEWKARHILSTYYGNSDGTSSPGTELKLEDLTMDTPCGNYWF